MKPFALTMVYRVALPLLLLMTACGSGGADGGGGSGGVSSTGGGGLGGATGGALGSGGASGGLSSGGAMTGGASSGGSATGGQGAGSPAFLLGADITMTVEDEYWGATYRDGGVAKPLEEILQSYGFNAVRIDTFVDPSAVGGYAEEMEQPFRDLAHTIALAERVKARGMFFLLDLHMSDTWTNPGSQTTPLAWQGLGLSALETAVYDYVHDAVQALVDADARPDMVQIGNEITNGFLWESGRIADDDFSSFGRLLKSGIAAVRAVDPTIEVMLHIEKCHDLATSRWWLDGVLDEGVEFDVLGQSCYAAAVLDGETHHPGYQGTPADWATTFEALAEEYPALDFLVAEYSAEPRAAADVLRALPEGRGRGTFNWNPTRFYETHPNVPLFDTDSAWNDYVAIPERLAVFATMADDYGLR